MPLSRLAQQFADEIRNHDWSDAPFRRDRAGHQRAHDTKVGTEVLTEQQTDSVRMNVMWVAAQVLGYNDPNFDVHEFADACGVRAYNRHGHKDGTIDGGTRRKADSSYARPGTWDE